MKKVPYLQIVGALLYLSTQTRPDLQVYMSTLCGLMHNPSEACFEAAQQVLLYRYKMKF